MHEIHIFHVYWISFQFLYRFAKQALLPVAFSIDRQNTPKTRFKLICRFIMPKNKVLISKFKSYIVSQISELFTEANVFFS